MSLTLEIPTVNDKLNDFDCLFQLWQKVNEECSEVIFDFSKCWFLRPNAVAFLGGLIRLIESRGRKVTFKNILFIKKSREICNKMGLCMPFARIWHLVRETLSRIEKIQSKTKMSWFNI